MTATAPNIIQLVASVMTDVTHVGKDGWNPGQKFKFRGIDAVVNAVGPALRKAGVVPTPVLETVTYRDILTGGNRTPMQQCTVQVRYQFWGPAGDHLDVVVPGEAFDSGDKGTAKAMSVAYRTALLQLLALPTDEPDPDVVSYERAPHTVTDQTWFMAVKQRIDTAVDTAVLNRIGAEIGTQSDAGNLTAEDGTILRGLFDARWAQLQAEARQAPADDEWTLPAETPQSKPPSPLMPKADQKQHARMAILLKEKRGITDDDQSRTALAAMVHRPVPSRTELTKSEASSVIETLTAEPDHVPLPDNPVRDILAGGIDAATSPATLDEAGRDVTNELTRGSITPGEAEHLRGQWRARKGQLQAEHAQMAGAA
jgi:hypothetical protein